jgi:RND family efflux transporter MFP subunit
MEMRHAPERKRETAPPAHQVPGGSGDGQGAPAHTVPERIDQHEPLEHHDDISALPKVRTLTVVLAAVVAAAAFAGLFLLGFLPRRARLEELNAGISASDPRPVVEVMQPHRATGGFDLRLPADVQSMQQTSLFARANGYLKRLLVDIGDRVQGGQLLAEIDTPEVDAQLEQANAGVALAEANLAKAQNDFELADATLKRYTGFSQSGGVTQQQLDEKRSAFTEAQTALSAANASVAAAHADVQRLGALQGFEKVTAPFGGIITARNYDLGALISPAEVGPGKELFQLDRTDVLRVFVNVPQAYVGSIKTGDQAYLSVRNYPGREFTGTVTRSAGAIDPATRTLRTQIDVPNQDGALYSGMYGEVRFHLSHDDSPIMVPASALVFDAAGTRVWVVENGNVHQRPIVVGFDLGTELQVESGLTGEESVVTNPGARLSEGVEVRIASQANQAGDGKGRTP